jgi:hypothetical protein
MLHNLVEVVVVGDQQYGTLWHQEGLDRVRWAGKPFPRGVLDEAADRCDVACLVLSLWADPEDVKRIQWIARYACPCCDGPMLVAAVDAVAFHFCFRWLGGCSVAEIAQTVARVRLIDNTRVECGEAFFVDLDVE